MEILKNTGPRVELTIVRYLRGLKFEELHAGLPNPRKKAETKENIVRIFFEVTTWFLVKSPTCSLQNYPRGLHFQPPVVSRNSELRLPHAPGAPLMVDAASSSATSNNHLHHQQSHKNLCSTSSAGTNYSSVSSIQGKDIQEDNQHKS